jgi:2-C-methyl-D-erythritol 4-phosphate cytidylyltransferase
MEKKVYAVILAGGHGQRMGASVPKQFLPLDGKPILRHTVEKFLSLGREVEIITVIPSDGREYWKRYCEESGFLQRYIMPTGGITRFHSVQNALKYVPDGAVVAVHDGVRPFVEPDFLNTLIDEAEQNDAVIPVIPPVESVRTLETDGSSFAVDRSRYVLVQTPQVFKSEILKKAYAQPYSPAFTDDASVVEAAGFKVKLVPGSRNNIKLTTPEDLSLAEAICRISKKDNL